MKKKISASEKDRLLKSVARRIVVCPRCPELVRNRTHAVPGGGDVQGTILLIGEAPGAQEDRRGEPFVGAAGRKLDQLLKAVGMARETLFITNVVKCRPPENRKPTGEEIENCRPYLERQIEILRPGAIVALGATAAHWLTGGKESIDRLRGKVHHYRQIPVISTYHPAYLWRNPEVEAKMREDLQRLMWLVERKE